MMTKSYTLLVRLDPFERNKLEQLATATGSTRAEVIRQLIRKAKVPRPPRSDTG
jgi:predicted transcriptional regulator